MPWQRFANLRYGRIYRDDVNPQRFAADYACGTRLHHESVIDSGEFDAEVDFTPERVVSGALDGWRVTQADWHYALGIPGAGGLAGLDGVVGFGGRKGQNWFKFRLQRVGYIHRPTRAWDDIGGAPDYKRGNLSQQTSQCILPTLGEAINASSEASWGRLWVTPGGGEISLKWRIDGAKLKEEITLNAAGRNWIAANRPPSTPLSETYFGFSYRLDVSDIPKWVKQGIQQDLEGDFDCDEPCELRDDVDRLLAFLPLDYVTVFGSDPSNLVLARETLHRRFYKEGGNYWLVVGVRCDLLNAMPAGDLVFDPTIDYSVGTGTDDAYEAGGTMTLDGTWAAISQLNRLAGYRWTGVTIPNGATIDVATVDWSVTFDTWDTPHVRFFFHDTAAPGTFTTDANNISGRTKTTAYVDLDVADMGAANHTYASVYITLPELKTIIQELVDSYDYSAGSSMVCIVTCLTAARIYGTDFYEYNSASNVAKLHIEYNTGGGLFRPQRNLNGLGVGGPFFENPLG